MELKVYSVYDSKTEVYSKVFYAHTRGEAIRSFTDSVNRQEEGNLWNTHPADYTLFELGTWDDNTGKFEQLLTPVNIGLATHFKRREDIPVMPRDSRNEAKGVELAN